MTQRTRSGARVRAPLTDLENEVMQAVWTGGPSSVEAVHRVVSRSRDLKEATNTWLQAVAQGNPELKLGGQQQPVKMSQRTALATPLLNPSPLGGQEHIVVYTTFLSDGTLFYYLTIAPEKDAQALQETFQKIGQSIKLTEVR